jgi:C4-dicarboxylate-specific signal transduction histidine kinase
MNNKRALIGFAMFFVLAIGTLTAAAVNIRPISDYGQKVIKPLSEDPVILKTAQESGRFELSSPASAKLKDALKANNEALLILVMNKAGVVVAASSEIKKKEYKNSNLFRMPLTYGEGSHYISKLVKYQGNEFYYYSLPLMAGNEIVGVICVAISPKNLLK